MGMDKDERKKMNRREWYVYWIIPTIILVISTAFFMRDTMVARMYTEDMREICELQEIELYLWKRKSPNNLDCNKWNLFLDYESKSGKGVES